jgi:hypothetical protein
MLIEGHHRRWLASSESELDDVLKFRDNVGGAQFWLSTAEETYPLLAIRVSGDVGDVHYFPDEGVAGFRALSPPEHQGPDDVVLFRYEGADPADGEEVAPRFVLPFSAVADIARQFLRSQSLPKLATWLEL